MPAALRVPGRRCQSSQRHGSGRSLAPHRGRAVPTEGSAQSTPGVKWENCRSLDTARTVKGRMGQAQPDRVRRAVSWSDVQLFDTGDDHPEVSGASGPLKVSLKVTCEHTGRVHVGWSTHDLLDSRGKPALIGMGSRDFATLPQALGWIAEQWIEWTKLLPPF